MDVPRPTQTVNPTAKLKDTANTEEPQLSFQRKAVQEFRLWQADLNDAPSSSTVGANPQALSADTVIAGLTLQNKCSILSIDGSDAEDGIVDYPVPCMSSSLLIKVFSHLWCMFYSQKEARCDNHITGKARNVNNSWNNRWCGHDGRWGRWGEYTHQGYDFSNHEGLSTFFDIVLGKKKGTTLGNPQATDSDGLLVDVDVQPVDDNLPTCEDRQQDVV